MANQIAEKLEALNCPENMRENALEFSASLNLVSLEELKDILDFLMEKGVIKKEEGKLLLSPGTFKILPRGLEYIKGRVAEMEEIDELDAYKEKPYRFNMVDSNLRLLYMKNKGEPYKTESGKYSILSFKKREFVKKYGNVDLGLVNTNTETEKIKDEVATPVVESTPAETITEDTTAETITDPTPIIPVTSPEETSVIGTTPIEPITYPEETKVVAEETEEVPIMDEVNETQDNIIDAERYENLSSYLSNLYRELFGMDNVPSDMLDCLKRFMEETNYDDKDLLYELLTSGSDYPEEAKTQIMDAIEAETGTVRMVA